MTRRFIPALLTLALIAGCATPPVGKVTPVGDGAGKAAPLANAEWHNLGVSPNGNILHEIDKLSIKPIGPSRYTFRDRKTVFNPKKEDFRSTTPHKFSLNQWELDCSARTIRLTGMALYDQQGREIGKYTYNDSQIKAMPVVRSSASYQQMEFICGANPA